MGLLLRARLAVPYPGGGPPQVRAERLVGQRKVVREVEKEQEENEE